MRAKSIQIPKVYPARVILKHYEGSIRRLGRKLAFLLLVVAGAFLAEPTTPGRAPHRHPTSDDLEAIADTNVYDSTPWRSPFWQGAVPEKEWFPEGQKRPPCEPSLEIEWKERCWTPHKSRKPPCPLGKLWQMGDTCLVPVFRPPRKDPGTALPQE